MGAMDALIQEFGNAFKKEDHSSYSKLSIIASDMEQLLREHVQDETLSEITKIIRKLSSGDELSPQEVAFVRLWLVSDAESYLRHENNYRDWLQEIGRLYHEILGFKNINLDVERSLQVRSLLLDLMRTLGSINFFLQQKERVVRFEESIKQLDDDERRLIIDLLKSKMKSDRFKEYEFTR